VRCAFPIDSDAMHSCDWARSEETNLLDDGIDRYLGINRRDERFLARKNLSLHETRWFRFRRTDTKVQLHTRVERCILVLWSAAKKTPPWKTSSAASSMRWRQRV
jgi:hypothetical protein